MTSIQISNDTIEQIDALADQLNETTKLDDKIKLHNELNTYIQSVEHTIDSMCSIIDNIDFDTTCNDSKYLDSYDIDSVNLDQLLSDLKDEPIIQTKITYMQHMLEHIKKCKKICDKKQLVITKCN